VNRRRTNSHSSRSQRSIFSSASSSSSADSVEAIFNEVDEADTSSSIGTSEGSSIIYIYHDHELTVNDVESFQGQIEDLDAIEDRITDAKEKHRQARRIYKYLYSEDPIQNALSSDFGSPDLFAYESPLADLAVEQDAVFQVMKEAQETALIELKSIIRELRDRRFDMLDDIKDFVNGRRSVFVSFYEKHVARLLDRIERINRKRQAQKYAALKSRCDRFERYLNVLREYISPLSV